jgi:hypothetical protein
MSASQGKDEIARVPAAQPMTPSSYPVEFLVRSIRHLDLQCSSGQLSQSPRGIGFQFGVECLLVDTRVCMCVVDDEAMALVMVCTHAC